MSHLPALKEGDRVVTSDGDKGTIIGPATLQDSSGMEGYAVELDDGTARFFMRDELLTLDEELMQPATTPERMKPLKAGDRIVTPEGHAGTVRRAEMWLPGTGYLIELDPNPDLRFRIYSREQLSGSEVEPNELEATREEQP